MNIEDRALNETERDNAIKLKKDLEAISNRTALEDVTKRVKDNLIDYPVGVGYWLDRVMEEYDIAMEQRLILRKHQMLDPVNSSGVDSYAALSMKIIIEKASQSKLRRGINTITNFAKATKKEFKKDWRRIEDRFKLSR